jgi:hypothetical protein
MLDASIEQVSCLLQMEDFKKATVMAPLSYFDSSLYPHPPPPPPDEPCLYTPYLSLILLTKYVEEAMIVAFFQSTTRKQGFFTFGIFFLFCLDILVHIYVTGEGFTDRW